MDEAYVRWIIEGLAGVVLLMFGGMIRRLFNKQDELERRKADTDSVDRRFADILSEMKEQRADLKMHEADDRQVHKDVLEEIRETNREIRQTNQHLATTNATLSNLVGRFDAHGQ